MRGALKWPVGDHLSPSVVMLQGWSYLLVGAAALVLTVLLISVPALMADDTITARWIFVLVLALGVVLCVCGTLPYIRSVIESRR
jgi:hypothetical protein